MKKISVLLVIFIMFILSSSVLAAQDTYVVKSGDSMWKTAVKYEVGLSEIINSNPNIDNPNLIYPGQTLNIPNIKDIKK